MAADNPPASGPGQRALFVGQMPLAAGHRAEGAQDLPLLQGCTLAQITPALLQRLSPDVVVTPLLAATHDAQQVAEKLAGAGFGGALHVLCPPLPNPALVLRDLQAAAPGLHIELRSRPPRAAH